MHPELSSGKVSPLGIPRQWRVPQATSQVQVLSSPERKHASLHSKSISLASDTLGQGRGNTPQSPQATGDNSEESSLPGHQAWGEMAAGRPTSGFRKHPAKSRCGQRFLRISLTNTISRLRVDVSHTTEECRRRQNRDERNSSRSLDRALQAGTWPT